jgi:hypothetical protein
LVHLPLRFEEPRVVLDQVSSSSTRLSQSSGESMAA